MKNNVSFNTTEFLYNLKNAIIINEVNEVSNNT